MPKSHFDSLGGEGDAHMPKSLFRSANKGLALASKLRPCSGDREGAALVLRSSSDSGDEEDVALMPRSCSGSSDGEGESHMPKALFCSGDRGVSCMPTSC